MRKGEAHRNEKLPDYAAGVRQFRSNLALTQAELAEQLGVSFATVNRWENGKSKPSQLAWERLLELARNGSAGEQSVRAAVPESIPFAQPAAVEESGSPAILDFTSDPQVVRSLAEGERLSYGHLANPFYGSELASIDPLPHQRVAVYDHMLQQFPLRFLLGDDAGAGKTIMSGLYIREMLSRRLIRRILVVPPAGLIGNWQRELEILFGLPFRITSGDDAKRGNPFIGEKSDRLIVSVDTLAGSSMYSRLKDPDVEPYDLVIFDEAHKLSAQRGADYRVRKTDRYRLAEALAAVPDVEKGWELPWRAIHLLLLTATPHMGKDYPYYSLWRLLDPHVLSTPEVLERLPRTKKDRHFLRRTKEEMVRLDGTPLYPKRLSSTLTYKLSAPEQGLYNQTTEYLKYVYNQARILNQSAARLALGVFQRRLASSSYALYRSLERRAGRLEQTIDDLRSGRITPEQLLNLQRERGRQEDLLDTTSAGDEATGAGREENEDAEDSILAGAIAASLPQLLAEKEQVDRLLDLARELYEEGVDSKLDKLREIVSDPAREDEKLLIFTEHKDTLEFLINRLSAMGYAGQIAHIHGGMFHTERQAQIERFRANHPDGGARIMVCTDAASEGVNLQFCWTMVNYDIPWNPARLEQRMGRIHRYGQQHDPVVILNLVSAETREGRVLKTLLEKLQRIREQLRSDKVFDVIGRVFSDISIKDYMERLVTGDDADAVSEELGGRLTAEQVEAIAQQERRLYGDGGDVKRELPRLRESIDRETQFRLLPGYVESFIGKAAPRIGVEIEGPLDGEFTMIPRGGTAFRSISAALESYQTTSGDRFSVSRPDDPTKCIWLHPGEPVFESFRQTVAEELGPAARKGAIFLDPRTEEPYLFHLLRVSVLRKEDPHCQGLETRELLECRLVGIKQFESGRIEECDLEQLLLLRDRQGLPAPGQRLAANARKHVERAAAYATETIGRRLAGEHRERYLSDRPDRRRLIGLGFDYREADLAAARVALSKKARAGNQGAAAELTKVKRKQRELSAEREATFARLSREPELIVPGEVEFIAHAVVVPSSDPEEKKRQDAEVESIAMEIARAYEESRGARVRYVHTPALALAAGLPAHPGYDLLSDYPDGSKHCIEVKGRAAMGEVELSENEWSKSCILRGSYWLYAVYECGSSAPQLYRVQDPFGKLIAKATGSVRIDHRQIRDAAEV